MCKACGYSLNDDLVAAMNIHHKGYNEKVKLEVLEGA